MILIRTFIVVISFQLFWNSTGALAESKKGPSRQKVIDFEGELVEGVNKRPLDSLSEIGDSKKSKKKSHLYRKRQGFRTETQETLREMRYLE